MAMDTYGLRLRVQSDMAGAQNDLQKMQGSLTSMIGSFAKVTVGVTSFTAVLVTMKKELTASYQASIKFNEGMAKVATLIPGNVKRVEELKDGLKDLSRSTGKPIDDLTDGLYQVVSALGDDIETQERMQIVSATSVAGMSSTTDALNLLTAVTKAYGDTSAVAMRKASDLAFLTLKWGQTSFPELAHSIQQVTDSSMRLNVSQEELFATFATLTGVSGDASTVATQLRSALVALEAPSSELAKLYNELGVASGKVLIEQYGLQGALEHVINYSNKTGTSLQSLMGRVQAMSAAYNLGSSQAETYAWKLEEIKNYSGATDTALNEVTSGINEQGFELQKLKASWEVVRTEMGDRLQPTIDRFIRQASVVVTSLVKNRDSATEMSNALDALIKKTNTYKGAVSGLGVDIDSLSESERVLYDVRVMQHSIDMQQAARELALAYNESENEIDGLKDKLGKLDAKMAKNLETLENSTEGQWAWINGWKGILPIMAPVIDLVYNEARALNQVNEAQGIALDIGARRAQQLEGLVTLAKAVVDGFLDISQYELTAPDFYNAVMEQVKKMSSVTPPSLIPAAKGMNTDAVIESFIGFSAKDLKLQLTKYEDELSKLNAEEKLSADYSNKKAHYEKIISSLKGSIVITEKEYVDKKRDALSWSIKEAEATGELGKLDVERLKALDEIKKANGENAELTELVNTLYKTQGDLIKRNFSEQLESQAFAVTNENDLLDIEEQRRVALRDLNREHLDTQENVKKINDLYDAMRDKTIELAERELKWRVQSNERMTDLEKLELERQREIAETNRKYGEQIELINLINQYYDRQKLLIQQNKSYIDDMNEAFEKAIGTAAYKKFEDFNRGLQKVGDTISSLSMVWSAWSSAITEAFNTADMLNQKEIRNKQETLSEEENARDEALDLLRTNNDERLSSLKEMYDGDSISYDEYISRKLAIDAEYEEAQREAQIASIEAENELKRVQYEAEVEQFNTNKMTAISNAIISGAQGIMQAWALGPIVGAIGSALIGGAMAYQISQISSRPAPSPPKYTEIPALAEGGVATGPTHALIGEAGEPEAVVPLSKAKDFGFGGGGDTFNITGNTFVGIGGIDELLILMEKRRSVLVGRGVI